MNEPLAQAQSCADQAHEAIMHARRVHADDPALEMLLGHMSEALDEVARDLHVLVQGYHQEGGGE